MVFVLNTRVRKDTRKLNRNTCGCCSSYKVNKVDEIVSTRCQHFPLFSFTIAISFHFISCKFHDSCHSLTDCLKSKRSSASSIHDFIHFRFYFPTHNNNNNKVYSFKRTPKGTLAKYIYELRGNSSNPST